MRMEIEMEMETSFGWGHFSESSRLDGQKIEMELYLAEVIYRRVIAGLFAFELDAVQQCNTQHITK